MLAPWPAARPTLAFLKLVLRPANGAFPGHLLLRIFDPADELDAGQRRDVLPGIECRGVSYRPRPKTDEVRGGLEPRPPLPRPGRSLKGRHRPGRTLATEKRLVNGGGGDRT